MGVNFIWLINNNRIALDTLQTLQAAYIDRRRVERYTIDYIDYFVKLDHLISFNTSASRVPTSSERINLDVFTNLIGRRLSWPNKNTAIHNNIVSNFQLPNSNVTSTNTIDSRHNLFSIGIYAGLWNSASQVIASLHVLTRLLRYNNVIFIFNKNPYKVVRSCLARLTQNSDCIDLAEQGRGHLAGQRHPTEGLRILLYLSAARWPWSLWPSEVWMEWMERQSGNVDRPIGTIVCEDGSDARRINSRIRNWTFG